MQRQPRAPITERIYQHRQVSATVRPDREPQTKMVTKRQKSCPKFVKMDHAFMNSPAWLSLRPGPQALYLALKKLFNGHNNGSIYLSHRDAAQCLNVDRKAAGRYFKELEQKGFIKETKKHHLGPEGFGRATNYALTEEALNGSSATRDYLKWKP